MRPNRTKQLFIGAESVGRHWMHLNPTAPPTDQRLQIMKEVLEDFPTYLLSGDVMRERYKP